MKTSLLLPHQSLFLQAPLLFPQLRFFLLVCGYGCVRGNTLLDTPKGKVAIKDFKGGLLYSWDGNKVVEAFALPSVKTSAKKMYRIEFTDSSFIVCPQSHQLLTRGGYKDVRSVFYTISLSSTSFSSRLRSIEESSPLGSPSSVPRLIHKGVGLIYRCLLYFRRCGVPLLFLKEAYRELFPLPHDEASCSSYQDEQEYTRLYHASSFFGRFYSFLHSPVKVFESLLFVRTSGAISQEGQEAALSAASKAHSHRGLLSSLFSLFSDCIKPLTVLFSKEYSFIRSISYVGEYEKWDLHVPTYNNYISQGLIHHNSGKTNALAKNILYHAIQLQGKKDADNRSPRLLLAGITMSHLEKTTVLFLKQDLDASCTPYRHDKKHNMITIGSVIIILASIVDYASLTGFDVHASFVDEADDASGADNKGDITYEAIKAVNERTRQRIKGCRNPFVQIASTSQGTEGLYHVYVDFIANKMAFLLIRGKTRDNFYLGEDYISSMEKTYTETERKVYMEGEFLALSSGKVFSDFDWDKNYISSSIDTTVIASETIYFSLDINSGYNRGCIGIIRDSKIFIIKRYEFKNLRDAPSVVRYEFPHNKILWLPDNSAKDTIVTLKREMMKFNIFWILRSKNPSREDSVFAVNKLLYTQRLIFTRLAQETAKAIEGLQRDKNNAIPQGKAPSSYVHDCDAVRMMVYFILCTKSEFVDIARVTIARHREIFDEDSPPPAIQSLNAGYSLIPASTIPD